MKVWITKYALSPKGIYQADGEINNYGHGDRFSVEDHHGAFGRGEFFESKNDAIVDAEIRRRIKMTSLEKQLAKLDKLKF